MKLTNTLTKAKQDFKPITPYEVTLYTCGPTVYDYAHIGNLRSFVFDDLLRRSLQLNYKVKHVMNITDVGHLVSDADEGEDKLEKGARREGKTVWQVAEYYSEVFKQDMAALNILHPNGYTGRPDGYARATDFIEQQINMIKLLIDKGFAYQAKQAIYFDVTKLTDYGKLSGQSLADKAVGARDDVVTDPDKKHPYDFAVWFFTVGHFKDHTMHWPSPWGNGFPGWHLECSAIIHSTLGEPIDIHTGGVDHIGTHHTNEIAQSEAAFGLPLANFWLHNEFVMVDGAKMSKSLGNYYRLQNITQKGYHPLSFRLLCLQAHYRSQLNFTWQSLEAAQNFLINLYAFADMQFQASPKQSGELSKFWQKALESVTSALMDDMHSEQALSEIATVINGADALGLLSTRDADELQKFLKSIESVLGLNLASRQDISSDAKALIDEREQARQTKDFAKSDQIRDQLAQEGIAVEDTPCGPRWRRTKLL
jgi:cysteinyl-tRNA synthetase